MIWFSAVFVINVRMMHPKANMQDEIQTKDTDVNLNEYLMNII